MTDTLKRVKNKYHDHFTILEGEYKGERGHNCLLSQPKNRVMKINISIDTEDLKNIIDIINDLLKGWEVYWCDGDVSIEQYTNLVKSLESQLRDKSSVDQ